MTTLDRVREFIGDRADLGFWGIFGVYFRACLIANFIAIVSVVVLVFRSGPPVWLFIQLVALLSIGGAVLVGLVVAVGRWIESRKRAS